MKRSHIAGLAPAGSLGLASGASLAGITLDGTRVVLAAPSKEASVLVRNRAAADVMIRARIDGADDKADVPFAITPTLGRLGAEKQQTLRILYYGQGLPTDRESVFWVNVQEIRRSPGREHAADRAAPAHQALLPACRPARRGGKAPAQLRWRPVPHDGKAQLR